MHLIVFPEIALQQNPGWGKVSHKPTQEELEMALATAKMMREQGDDPCYMAKALLNCHYQSSFLREVLQAAQEYLRAGQSESTHTRLLRAVSGSSSKYPGP